MSNTINTTFETTSGNVCPKCGKPLWDDHRSTVVPELCSCKGGTIIPYEEDLCRKMLSHAAFSKRTGDKTPSEIREVLKIFFDDETIDNATKKLCGDFA